MVIKISGNIFGFDEVVSEVSHVKVVEKGEVKGSRYYVKWGFYDNFLLHAR